jgi:hypothetical protein
VAEFERFQEELDRSKFKYDFDILADYWNALGTLWEAQAWLRPELKVEFAQRAKIAYEKGLQFTSGWIAAKSNLARFYQEVSNDLRSARPTETKTTTTVCWWALRRVTFREVQPEPS